jgi:hypothetical protein
LAGLAHITRQSGVMQNPQERREHGRARLSATFANKYIDGIPHAVELLDVSAGGLRIRNIFEPRSDATSFPFELCVDGMRLWVWAKQVWKHGNREALEIIAADPVDRARFKNLLRPRAYVL